MTGNNEGVQTTQICKRFVVRIDLTSESGIFLVEAFTFERNSKELVLTSRISGSPIKKETTESK